jgi:hypothetical protein
MANFSIIPSLLEPIIATTNKHTTKYTAASIILYKNLRKIELALR